MKCKSCKEEVSPKFMHAISVNSCPFCGQEIMDTELKETLNNLKSVMTATEKYSVEIFDWLKSNFNLISEIEVKEKLKEMENKISFLDKKASSNPTQKSEISLDANGNQISGKSIQDPDITNKFMQKAGVSVNKNLQIKNLLSQIKGGGSQTLLDEEDSSGMIDPEMLTEGNVAAMSTEELEQLDMVISGESRNHINSSIDSGYDEEEIPPFVLNMAANKGKSDYNARDVLKLQNLQNKSQSASNALNRGGSIGKISRG